MTRLFDMIGIETSSLETYIPVQMPDMSLAVIIIPIWCLFYLLGYKIKPVAVKKVIIKGLIGKVLGIIKFDKVTPNLW
ncbi:Uncharacterised protein [Bartonella vinsonii]|uniref:Uncharacterized protein n=1 Tax=Bartonella vinsonii TaxID=33047 RepID=A0A3S5C5S9_BARVI|nr:Uncharacterised protein [Bartonella vinsonii]